MKKSYWIIVGLLLGVGALGTGLYIVIDKSLKAQEAALPKPGKGPGLSQKRSQEQIQKDRLQNTLETLDRNRQINEQTQQKHRSVQPQDPTAHIRKTLQTIEDINRINRLNQQAPRPVQPPQIPQPPNQN